MRRSLWTLILLLLASVISAAAIPPADIPETCYNESDRPINQTPPVELGVHFERPVQVANTVPRTVIDNRGDIQSPVEELIALPLPAGCDVHIAQAFLCTLLI
ncbi:MAG TPA: hypothetical protein VMI10_04805 [Terriglobales bacterium]|nr:hypothetical protein [Terriglobales bacterium]